MTFTIELRRCGTGSSPFTIPIVARVKQGSIYGADLLAGLKVTDIEQAQRASVDALEHRFRTAVTVMWDDRTKE